MESTIRIDDDLLAAIREQTATTGEDVSAFIQNALRQELATRRAVADSPAPELPVFAGDGLLPGVDLNNWDKS